MKKVVVDDSLVSELYAEKLLPVVEVAKRIGCCRQVIYKSLSRSGIPIRKTRGAESIVKNGLLNKRDVLFELYVQQNKTAEEISRRFKCPINAVTKALRFHGIVVRNRGIGRGRKLPQWWVDKIKSFYEKRYNDIYNSAEEANKARIRYRHTRRQSVRLNKWSREVRARDKQCSLCGSTKELEAHHIVPIVISTEMAFDINNGVALCRECHDSKHRHLVILGGS